MQIPTHAQSVAELITDRPDKTESGVTVPEGSLQIETGFEFQYEKVNEIVTRDQFNIASTLLRYGVIKEIEIRVGGVFLSEKIQSSEEKITSSGLAGLMFGAKYNFTRGSNLIPDIGLLIHFFLPAGAAEFKPPKVEPQAIFSASKSLNGNVSIATNLGIQFNSNEKLWENFYTLATGIALTEDIGAFVELYSELSKGTLPFFSAGTGLTYLLKDNLQLDISLGRGLFNNSESWFIGTGFSIQL